MFEIFKQQILACRSEIPTIFEKRRTGFASLLGNMVRDFDGFFSVCHFRESMVKFGTWLFLLSVLRD